MSLWAAGPQTLTSSINLADPSVYDQGAQGPALQAIGPFREGATCDSLSTWVSMRWVWRK